MKLKDLKNNLAEKLARIRIFLKEKNKWILFFIFLFFMGYCVYLWHSYVYNPKWSESRKQEYISTKEREVIFKKDKFDSVISEIKKRKENYQKSAENTPDIFKLK